MVKTNGEDIENGRCIATVMDSRGDSDRPPKHPPKRIAHTLVQIGKDLSLEHGKDSIAQIDSCHPTSKFPTTDRAHSGTCLIRPIDEGSLEQQYVKTNW
jgi:hypothetical protein